MHTKRKCRYYYYSHFTGKITEVMKEFRDHPAGREQSSDLTKDISQQNHVASTVLFSIINL